MPGSDFEKQVQQKMDELNFAPSDVVWQGVEKQIAERKKRRVLFLWLPVLFLLMGGAAWVYHALNNQNRVTDKTTVPTETKTTNNTVIKTIEGGGQKETIQSNQLTESTVKPQAIAQNKAVGSNNGSKNAAADGIQNIEKNNHTPARSRNIYSPVTVDKNNHKKNVSIGFENKDAAGKASTGRIHELTATLQKNTGSKIMEKPVAGHEENLPVITALPIMDDSGYKKEFVHQDNKIAFDTALAGPAAIPGTFITKADTTSRIPGGDHADSTVAVAHHKSAGNRKKKLDWGIEMSAGLSNISQNFSGLFSSTASYDATRYPGLQNNSTGNMGGINNTTFSKPSDLRRGFAFSTGIFVRKTLAKNFSFLTGLNYRYYGSSMDVGAKIDSNKAAVQYRAGNAAAYTNRFHFIQLPLIIEKQLGTKSRFAVNGGLSLSLLASSNALLYDGQKNIYYADNNYINKIQAGLLAGFNYRIWQKAVRIEAGPRFNYNLTSVFKNNAYSNGHLFFGGITAMIFFQKNK